MADKLSQFARNRRGLVAALAADLQMEVPPEVGQFFDAAEAGRWEELQILYEELRQRRDSEPDPPKFQILWHAILETYGAAEQVRLWPAGLLLDYGQSILDTLRPGMVYVGGTDPGRFIPTLLIETSGGERHVVLTQNALADASYWEYVRRVYADRLAGLTAEDLQRAFGEYVADARERFLHDQQFPDEPKRVRPGEDIRLTDGGVKISGSVAVMAVNERLLQALMDKNADRSFVLEESLPLPSTYADAAPLGPLLELRVPDPEHSLTPERVAGVLEQWRAVAQSLLADPEFMGTPAARSAYAKMAAAQGGLLLERGFMGEAEQTLRLAAELGRQPPIPCCATSTC